MKTSPLYHQNKTWDRFTLGCLLILLAIGIHITRHLEANMDILLWDEANYLSRGLWMFHKIPKVWGPSYSAWYKVLSFIQPDKISLYYLNYKVMTIGSALAAFLLLSVCGLRQWIALLLCSFLLLSSFNLPAWPKISHYCIIVVMLAIVVSKQLSSALARWSVFSLALLVCAYARPELFLSFAACFIITLYIAFRQFKNSKTAVRIFFCLTAAWILFICWYYKTPFNSGDSGRSIKVFYQHFAMNYIQWHHLNLSWWLDWQDIISKNITHPESVSSMIRYDGPLFWKHIFSNLQNYIIGLGSLIAQFFAAISLQNKILYVLSGIGLVIYFLFARLKGFTNRFKISIRENAEALLFLLIFIFPGILVCVYAYPRTHYLVIDIPLTLLLFGMVLSALQPEDDSIKKWLASLLAIAVFIFAPDAQGFDFYQLERKTPSLANRETLRYLQQLQPADTLKIFDLEGDLTSMLNGKYKGHTNAYLLQNELPLSQFIENNNIEMIYVTPSLIQQAQIKKDTVFIRLLENPSEYHFYPEKTGNFGPYLLIRRKP